MSEQDNPVSWDLFYLTKEGMEAHLQLKGATVEHVLTLPEAAVSKVQEAGGVGRPRANRGATAETSASDDPPKCGECGTVMKFRKGTSRSGKPYQGYFCPKRDCKGDPVWMDS